MAVAKTAFDGIRNNERRFDDAVNRRTIEHSASEVVITDKHRFAQQCPAVAFPIEGHPPRWNWR